MGSRQDLSPAFLGKRRDGMPERPVHMPRRTRTSDVGAALARFNALCHGITSSAPVIPSVESAEAWDAGPLPSPEGGVPACSPLPCALRSLPSPLPSPVPICAIGEICGSGHPPSPLVGEAGGEGGKTRKLRNKSLARFKMHDITNNTPPKSARWRRLRLDQPLKPAPGQCRNCGSLPVSGRDAVR